MKDPAGSPSTRKTLLLQIRDPNNTASWRTFVELYTPLIFHFCDRRGLQEADCRDVVQNVLLSVHRQIGNLDYDAERGLFRNWLITIILRQINRYQAHTDKGTVGRGGGDQVVEQVRQEAEETWNEGFRQRICEFAMERIREEFAPEVYAAFEAVWYYERKPAEVAQDLGQTPAWVYQAKYRVLKRLKQEIEFLGDGTYSSLPE